MKVINFISKIAVFLGAFPLSALAHTQYVVTPDEVISLGYTHGSISTVFEMNNLYLIIGTILLVVLLYTFIQHNHYCSQYFSKIEGHLKTYREFIPWILRICVGILLIGSSINGTLISPVISASYVSFTQLVIGFSILAGFLVTPLMVLTGVIYLYALTLNPYIFGNFEVLGAVLAYLAIGISRPGIDDILNIPSLAQEKLKKFAPLLMRIGLGVSLTYLALYEKFINTPLSFAVVEKYNLTSIIAVSPEMWVYSAGIIELFLGIAYLLGYKVRLISVITFVVLTTTLFGLGEDVSSHITLFGIVSALFITGAGKYSLDSWLNKQKLRI